ncbi:MAG: hypothetical protein OEL81_02730 [Nitrosopumilus sp.]|nr:hypothetical protein [Nitrosopumilus sp.]
MKGKNSTSLVLFFLLTISLVTASPIAFADEDEDDEKDEREDDDDEGLALGGGISDAILYGTISVIVGSVAYTGYKIYKTKKPKLTSR